MATPSAIYKLGPIYDDPRYEGFGTAKVPEWEPIFDQFSQIEGRFPGKVRRWAKAWKPLPVVGRVFARKISE